MNLEKEETNTIVVPWYKRILHILPALVVMPILSGASTALGELTMRYFISRVQGKDFVANFVNNPQRFLALEK